MGGLSGIFYMPDGALHFHNAWVQSDVKASYGNPSLTQWQSNVRAYITHPAARECHTQSRQGLGFTEAECKNKGSLRFGNCEIDTLLVIPNVKKIWMRLQKWKQTSSCSHCCFNCAAVMSLPGASERERCSWPRAILIGTIHILNRRTHNNQWTCNQSNNQSCKHSFGLRQQAQWRRVHLMFHNIDEQMFTITFTLQIFNGSKQPIHRQD